MVKENPDNKPDPPPPPKKPPPNQQPTTSQPRPPSDGPHDSGGSIMNNSVMLQTALRLGLRDMSGVQEYENQLDAKVTDHRETRRREIAERDARHEAERLRLLKEQMALEEAERLRLKLLEEELNRKMKIVEPKPEPEPEPKPQPIVVVVPTPVWKEDPDIPMTAEFLKDLNFAEMAKTPQGILMSMACLLHHEEVRTNAALREKMRIWLTKKLEAFDIEKYNQVAPLMLINHIRVQRQPIAHDENGEPTTRLASYKIFGFGNDWIFEASTTKSRPSCLGMCGSKNPKEITIYTAKDSKAFVARVCLSHYNGILPEWADVQMPENERYGTIHSTAQMHTTVENNYDIFDNKGRVIGVASPEREPNSNLINVTLYNKSGLAVAAKTRRINNEYGEYIINCPMEMGPDLKIILIALCMFWLVEDLGDYEGRGEGGR